MENEKCRKLDENHVIPLASRLRVDLERKCTHGTIEYPLLSGQRESWKLSVVGCR